MSHQGNGVWWRSIQDTLRRENIHKHDSPSHDHRPTCKNKRAKLQITDNEGRAHVTSPLLEALFITIALHKYSCALP